VTIKNRDMTRTFDDNDGCELTVELDSYGETIRFSAQVAAYTGWMSRYFTPAAARALAAHLVELADEAEVRAL
jgi:hypothetical protein